MCVGFIVRVPRSISHDPNMFVEKTSLDVEHGKLEPRCLNKKKFFDLILLSHKHTVDILYSHIQ